MSQRTNAGYIITDLLAGLGHDAVGGSNDQDSTVHLGSAGDHVLDIVSVAGAVNVSIVTVGGLIFDVSGGDCDTTGSLFGSFVDLIESHEIAKAVPLVKGLGNGSSQGGFTMVNVTDGTDVTMGFGSLELLFCHLGYSFWLFSAPFVRAWF